MPTFSTFVFLLGTGRSVVRLPSTCPSADWQKPQQNSKAFRAIHPTKGNCSSERSALSGAGGAVSMAFYCKDAAGHALVEARIESEHGGTPKAQSALFFVPVEASALDAFVE